jgi:hypothetical protein
MPKLALTNRVFCRARQLLSDPGNRRHSSSASWVRCGNAFEKGGVSRVIGKLMEHVTLTTCRDRSTYVFADVSKSSRIDRHDRKN